MILSRSSTRPPDVRPIIGRQPRESRAFDRALGLAAAKAPPEASLARHLQAASPGT